MSDNLQLIIFDCDGVLVDTERLANKISEEVLAELGWTMHFDEVVAAFMGRSSQDNLRTIAERLGQDKAELYLSRWRERAKARFQQGVKPIPGIEALLAGLDIPYCVASSGSHEKMRLTLGSSGLYPRFEGRIFSASEVANGKPAPDLFLHAARTMNAEPAHCVVVEDSVHGVRAGVAAGMTVFGYADLTEAEVLRDAGATVFDDMHQLPQLLGSKKQEVRSDEQ